MNQSSEKRVTEKPPKPFRPSNTSLETDDRFLAPPGSSLGSSDNENDVSTVSVRLNDDDLKQFEGDLTLGHDDDDEEDDDDEICSDKENHHNQHKPYKQSFLTNSSSHFNDLTNVSEANFFEMDSKMVPTNDISVSNLVNRRIFRLFYCV